MKSYGTLTSVNGPQKIERVAVNTYVSNGTVNKKITCAWTDKDTYTPAINTTLTENANYVLINTTQIELPAGLCEIILTYATDFDVLPDTTVVEQSSQIEVAIQEHPKFSQWSSEWDSENDAFLPSSDKYGITSYIKGTTTVTVTEYFYSKPASLRAQIGTRVTPGGDYGNLANWLIVGSTRQQQGKCWTRVTTYLWSAKEWNSDIYTA